MANIDTMNTIDNNEMKDSQTPQQERLDILKQLMPEIFDEGQIDFEKLKATLGENITFSNERYVLNWAGKSDAFRIMQRPSSATLVPCKEESVDFDTTQNIFIEGENMEVLKGLQKSYFGKVKMIYIDPPYNTGNDSFIYPDKFSESKEEYLKRIGDKDDEGYMTREGMFRKNSRENGQYHSNWLNMMMPRLYLAKSLLREDGVIFISIDDNEVHNLRLLMNEIFGEENFVALLVWEKKKKGSFLSNSITNVKEYILVYCRDINTFEGLIGEINSDTETYPCVNAVNKREIRIIPAGIESKYKKKNFFIPKGSEISDTTMNLILHSDLVITEGVLAEELIIEGNWRYAQSAMEEYAHNGELYITRDLYLRRIVGDARYKTLKDLLPRVGDDGEAQYNSNVDTNNLFASGWGSNEDADEELRILLGIQKLMDYPKPVRLILKLLASYRDKEALILDFFAGSGTTAHAVMQLNKEDGGNRKFICVQLPELCDPKSEACKAGYSTIAEISKERIRRAGAKIRTEVEKERALHAGELSFEEKDEAPMPDLGFKVFKLSESNFKQWREIRGSEQEQWKQQTIDFLNPVAKNASIDNMVYELLLKNGKSLNSAINHINNCYIINDGELILLLESADQPTIDYVLSLHPEKVIALDNLFAGNDQLKTNTALQLRDAGIEFKTI